MSVPVGTALDPASLEANRGGALTRGQRAAAQEMVRGRRHERLVFAVIAGVIGALVATSTGGDYSKVERYGVAAIAFVVAAVMLALWLTPGSDSLARDLRSGHVESVEGACGKHVYSGQRSRSATHYIDLGDRHYEVSRAAYDAAPEAGMLRLYLLSQSHHVVNFERLPDKALPDGAIESPVAAMETIVAGMHSHDQATELEARASMEALRDSLMPPNAAPPPASERDPRPLAEAVVGSWQWGSMRVAFAADGTASTVLPSGMAASGRWSVTGDTQFHLTGMGQDMAGDAWVAGDTLTVEMDGRAMAFHRTA